jgi:hypothetical protein
MSADPAPMADAAPAFPLSAQIQSVLMEDVIRGDQLKLGGADQSVALFINPATEDVEALVIYGSGLGWLHRDPGGVTGWKLDTVSDDGGGQVVAARVVVTVSPDRDVWGHYIDVNDHLAYWRLPFGAASWSFSHRDQSGAFAGPLGVAYPEGSLRAPTVYTTDGCAACWCPPGYLPSGTPPWFRYLTIVSAEQPPRLLSIIPGIAGNLTLTGAEVLSDNSLHLLRYTQGNPPSNLGTVHAPMSLTAAQVFMCSASAVINIDSQGGLSLSGLNSAAQIIPPPAGGAFVEFRVGYDTASRMHVYLRDSARNLWVLHQVGWQWSADANAVVPAWQQAETQDGAVTVAAMPIAAGIAEFFVLAQPFDMPAVLVHYTDPARFPELLELRPEAKDWSRATVRLAPSALFPVRRFVADVRLSDVHGVPVRDYEVRLTADAAVEAEYRDAGYTLGPQVPVALSTDLAGRVSLAVSAIDIATPDIHLTATGLPDGVVIQLAAPVHNYLAGAGSLPGREPISGMVLEKAQVNGNPLIPGWHAMGSEAAAVVIQNLARRGTGLPPLPDVSPSGDRVHGHHVIAQSLLPDRLSHAVFATREEADQEWELLRSHPDYAGVLDPFQDLLNFGADVLEGIKNGIAEVTGFAVHAAGEAVKMMIKIAGKVFELIIEGAAILIFGPDEGPRLAAAFFSWLGARFNDLLAWLGEKLAVKDAWDTMVILNDAITQTAIPATKTALSQFGGQVDDFFSSQQQQLHGLLETLREQVAGMTVGQCLPAGANPGQAAQLRAIQLGGDAGPVTADVLTSGPASWFTSKILGSADAFGPDPKLTFLTHPELVSDPVQDLTQVWDNFRTTMDRAGTAFRDALYGLVAELQDVLQPDKKGNADQAAFMQLHMTRLIDIFENLVDSGLQLADALCQAMLDLIQVVIKNIGALMDDESLLAGGFIDTLFTWIHDLARPGEPAPKVTPLKLGLLAVSFPLVWVTKATQGADAVPFPHGFPTAPDKSPSQVTGLSPKTQGMWTAASVIAVLQLIIGTATDLVPVGEELDESMKNKVFFENLSNVGSVLMAAFTFALAFLEWPSDDGLVSTSPFNSQLDPDKQNQRFMDWLLQYWVMFGLDMIFAISGIVKSIQDKDKKGIKISLAKNASEVSNIAVSVGGGICTIVSCNNCIATEAPFEGWVTDFVPNVNNMFQFLRQPELIEATAGGTFIAKIVLDVAAYGLQLAGCIVNAVRTGDLSFAAGGSPRSAPVNSQYPQPLSITVTNFYQAPLPDAEYTFTVLEQQGAGGTFAGTGSAKVTTNGEGVATAPPLAANGTSGDFYVNVLDDKTGIRQALFLHNFVPASGDPISAVGGAQQGTPVNKPFTTPLSAKVTDDKNKAVANVTVYFQVVTENDAAASFQGSSACLTNSDGIATSPVLIANGSAGSYTVTASVAGINDSTGRAKTAVFNLTNTSSATI